MSDSREGMTPEKAEDVERLSSIVHDLYQDEVKRQGRTLRHEDDYANLSEETKELDRVFVRWHLSRLEEVIEQERYVSKEISEAAIEAQVAIRDAANMGASITDGMLQADKHLAEAIAAYKSRTEVKP